MSRIRLLPLLPLLLPAPAGAAWRAPVDPLQVARPFAYDARAPFAAGQRRGADLRARPGAPVLAVCSGRVRHAGPLPGGGLGVSIACGGLVATELGLRTVRVRTGRAVRAGEQVGTAAALVRLGARDAADRFGYRDPVPLLRGGRPVPPALAPPPRRRSISAPPARPAAAPAPAAGPPPGLVAALLGAGVVAAIAGAGLVAHARRRIGGRPARRRQARPGRRPAGAVAREGARGG